MPCAVTPDYPSRKGARAKEDNLKRRNFVSGTAALAAAALARPAFAATIKPYSWDLNPPTDTRENFIDWVKGS